MTGNIKLESVAAGIAKLVSNVSVLSNQSPTPIKIATTSWIEVATSKPTKVEGTVTDLPAQNGMQVDTVKFVLERIK